MQKNGLSAKYYITSREKTFQSVIQTYVRRIFSGIIFSLKSPPPNIVYATSDALPDVLPTLIMKLRNKKVEWVQKIFHLIPKERKLSFYSQKLSFFFIRRFADVIIVDNDFLLKELENQKFPTDKIKVNYLGIDVGYFDSVSKTKRTFDAVFMGRLHKSKGIFDLVAIWKNILINLPNAKLAIIGTGEKKIVTELKDLIVKNGLKKNITMFGYLEDNHAYSLIKSSQVFVYPSYEEGFGMVIGEVMACKIPVIAYDLPAYTYTFKKAIQTVPLGNTHLFSRALLELLVSNEERERLTQKGYTLAKKYTWKSTVERERKYLW